MQRFSYRYLIAAGGAAFAGISLLATGAHAVAIVQKILKVDVVSAYNSCTPPGDSSTNSGFVSCLNPTLTDPICKFGPRGKGKVRLVAQHDNVNVYGVVSGVEAGCEAQTVQLMVSARITTDDCPPGASPPNSCTLVDFVDLALGSCQIKNGTCSVITTLNSAVPALVGMEKRTGIELNGCGWKRTTGSALPTRTFSCGIRVP